MNILWDLDGTLTDPKVGITRCMQHALREFGHPVPETSDLLWCIGPPMHKSFERLVPGSSPQDVWALVGKYRERFSELGLVENEVYPGIPEMLGALSAHVHFVATSKPHVFAQRITDHFGLSSYFRRVYGSELDGTRSEKGQLIAHILECEGITDAIMVGDRMHDILGGRANGLQTIGVTWGYGGREELVSAGADHIFDTPAELRAFLLS